jgi:hypothetical protein
VCSVACVGGSGVGGRWGVVSIVVCGFGVGGAVCIVLAIVVCVEMVLGCIVVVLGVSAIFVHCFLPL